MKKINFLVGLLVGILVISMLFIFPSKSEAATENLTTHPGV